MTDVVIQLVKIYKKYLSPLLHALMGVKNACRFTPTCSDYAIHAVREHGIVRGLIKSFYRIMTCQPFYSVK